MGGYLKRDWETFPVDNLKRVDKPTTLINKNEVQRVRERQAGFCKAAAGDYGPKLQKEFRRFVPKHLATRLSKGRYWMQRSASAEEKRFRSRSRKAAHSRRWSRT